MGTMSVRAMWTLGVTGAATLIAFGAFATLAMMRDGEARPAIPAQGNIFQSGILVGWATGARISSDGLVVEFDQIAHARQFAQQSEFEYGGLKLRIARVLQIDYAPRGENISSRGAARPDQTLMRVTARIHPRR